jgi:glutamate 5-kinase
MDTMDRTKYIRDARRVVLKLGTKVLLSHHNDIDRARIGRLVDDIAAFRQQGYEFIVVSSGAVGFGMSCLGLGARPERLRRIQALAAIGQNLLMQDWSDIFSKQDIRVGQMLLTYGVFEDRKRYLHAKDCISALLEYGAVPIVNENDSISVDELKFGDNDALSSITALLADADLQILFTDTDGVFDANPKESSSAAKLDTIKRLDDAFIDAIQDRDNGLSIGGMRSKLRAAKLSATSGTAVVIADGLDPDLGGILSGKPVGTFIAPRMVKINARKKWIFFNAKIKGRIVVDDGAASALLERPRSLLPSGIVDVEGVFPDGCVVGICKEDGELIARGVTYYSSDDIKKIMGRQTDDIRTILGRQYYDEVVDRNNLVLI